MSMKNFILLLRPSNWVKNIFVLVPLVFSKNLTNSELFLEATGAVIAFCFLSSAIYVLNDYYDTEKDRLHPIKRNRPFASGVLDKRNAFWLIPVLLIPVVLISLFLPFRFGIILVLYGVINFLYSSLFKQVVILDIMCVASGFMLRVIGGAYAIDVYVSSWLILTTLFLSLFLAIMKRRSEIEIVQTGATRAVLKDYSLEFISQISGISAAGVIICYALYTVAEKTVAEFHSENLVFTTIFVVFGLFRYMFLVYSDNKGENTLDALLFDLPSVINGVLYVITILLIIYNSL